jgi:hypothetical protein
LLASFFNGGKIRFLIPKEERFDHLDQESRAILSLAMIRKPEKNQERFKRVWSTHVHARKNRYEMDL